MFPFLGPGVEDSQLRFPTSAPTRTGLSRVSNDPVWMARVFSVPAAHVPGPVGPPDGKNSRDASGIVEPKLHRALFPSSRRDSGEGTRHSALKNAKDARTLLIWFQTLLYLFLSTEAWSSFSFFPPHRSPSLLPPPPLHHLAGRHSFLPHRHRSSIRESTHRQTLESTPSSRTSPDQQRQSTLDCPIRPGLPLSRR